MLAYRTQFFKMGQQQRESRPSLLRSELACRRLFPPAQRAALGRLLVISKATTKRAATCGRGLVGPIANHERRCGETKHWRPLLADRQDFRVARDFLNPHTRLGQESSHIGQIAARVGVA